MNVLALQWDIAWENKAVNFCKVRELLGASTPAPGSLLVLPEMFATGFSMNAEAIAEAPNGDTEQFLSGLARDFGVCVVAGAAMRGRDGRIRNKALVFSPEGNLLGFYAKMRTFTPGGETDHYTAGEHPVTIAYDDWRICPLVCYDLRFPELFRRAMSMARPELFVVIASWPQKRVAHWVKLLQARAIENQAYVLGCNRIGSDPYYAYSGRSLIVDPQGEIIADAGEQEGCIRAELDLETLRNYRRGLPFLDDMEHTSKSWTTSG